jgi:hypothetical protein
VLITEPFRDDADEVSALVRQREILAEELLERHKAEGVLFAPRDALVTAAAAGDSDSSSAFSRGAVVRLSATQTRVTMVRDGACSGPTSVFPIGVEHCRLHLGKLIAARYRKSTWRQIPLDLLAPSRFHHPEPCGRGDVRA